MYAAGFYTYSIFALIFWETRRSDFGVSMGHHVATVILIVLSYIFRYALTGSYRNIRCHACSFLKLYRRCFFSYSIFCRFARAGSVVLAIHDASDVFLEIGKMAKYGGAETIAGIAFPTFVLSFFLLRLVYYPFWVLWSTRFV